jgi:rod shape-determining protein MreC
MLKRPHYIAIGLIVVLILTMLNLPSQTAARLKLGIGSVFLPLFGLAASSQRAIEKAGESLVPRQELVKQNENLRRENTLLRQQLAENSKAVQENEKLRKLFGWQQRHPLKIKLGRVVLTEPANWWRTVQIDLGTRDGVSNNLPILSSEGYLVGKIGQATFARSQVLLLGDPNCKVAARIDPGGEMGIIGASGPLETGFVEMAFIRNANLKPGQNVRTSGKGGIFPENVPIGQIVDVRPIESGLSSVARVKLAANISALDGVWVRFPQ